MLILSIRVERHAGRRNVEKVDEAELDALRDMIAGEPSRLDVVVLNLFGRVEKRLRRAVGLNFPIPLVFEWVDARRKIIVT